MLAQDENFLKRFKTEARALAKLENPNIVMVHALRETEFGVFMVMEYVEAKTLTDWIREKGSFSWQDTLKISIQLLNAISHAHGVGVIHRDIKPGNILLTEDFKVKVTDFGLAKVIKQHGPASTVTQMRAGTLYYMSPEQVKGLKNVDFRSDIYSLGMTIYEMLAGRTPFEKTDSDFTIQKQIVEGHIPSPLKFNASIPKPLAKVITKSIEKDPEKRFQTADEMLEATNSLDSKEAEQKMAKPVRTSQIGLRSIIIIVAAMIFVLLGYVFIFDPFDSFSSGKDQAFITGVGNCSIYTDPDEASIILNDSAIGNSPAENLQVIAGFVSLQINKPGYLSIDTSVFIKKNQSQTFDFTLKQGLVANFSGADPGRVHITSNPTAASVWINRKFVGTTPRENEELGAGKYSVLVRKKGYLDYKKTFSIEQGQLTTIAANLEKAGKLTVLSEPAGAEVLFNNVPIGKTPVENINVKEGTHKIVLRKSGYEDYSTTVDISQKKAGSISNTLIPLKGILKILIRPWGSIYVDGKLHKEDTNIQYETELMAGFHKIKAVHPALGEWEKQIQIKSETTKEIVIDFNREVNLTITSEPNYCEIFLDGKSTGKYTPKQIKLKTGKHTISVRKEGYTFAGGYLEISVNEDVKDPLHFQLSKTP
jgi:serine/threonine protein kinase